MQIKTIKDLKELIKDMDDDYSIEFRVRTKISDEEYVKRAYPYPFDTEYVEGFEYDDTSVSDKVVCFGIERP